MLPAATKVPQSDNRKLKLIEKAFGPASLGSVDFSSNKRSLPSLGSVDQRAPAQVSSEAYADFNKKRSANRAVGQLVFTSGRNSVMTESGRQQRALAQAPSGGLLPSASAHSGGVGYSNLAHINGNNNLQV